MERGDDVTTCPMVSAEGKPHPCVFIFPLKKVSKKMVEAVPHGWLPLANKSGYMDESCFLKLLKHLRKQITLPPHTSHATQPLDRADYAALKRYINECYDEFIRDHPGQPITI